MCDQSCGAVIFRRELTMLVKEVDPSHQKAFSQTARFRLRAITDSQKAPAKINFSSPLSQWCKRKEDMKKSSKTEVSFDQELGLPLRAEPARRSPLHPLVAREGTRRIGQHQRHGLGPRQPGRLRRLGGGRQRRLGLPLRAAPVQEVGG